MIRWRCALSPRSWRTSVRRGEVYRFRLRERRGHEQSGVRFGVIVQSDAFLPRSTVLVAPTSRSARPASFRPEAEVDGETTRVLVEQLGAVDATRLGELAGQLSPNEMWGVDTALGAVLDLA